MKIVWDHLTAETRKVFDRSGIRRAVLGMSGGIDSALVYAICREAIGARNVAGIVMPSRFSSREAQLDAISMLETGGSEARTIPIDEAVSVFERMTPLTGIAHENVQARIRMVLMMGIANQENRLLVSTGNLSEIMVGYFTLHGDSAGAVSPIGDLYKTEVFELSRWADSNIIDFPDGILARAPSAELSDGQKDEDSLPDYRDLDQVLRHMAGEGPSHQNGVLTGRVTKLVRDSAFKRERICPGISVRHLI